MAFKIIFIAAFVVPLIVIITYEVFQWRKMFKEFHWFGK